MHRGQTTVMITGAGVRLGKAMAIALAKEGYKLLIHYNHSKEQAEALKKELNTFGAVVRLLQADFSNPEETQAMWDNISEDDLPQVLINNASVFYDTRMNTSGCKDWDRNIKINFNSAYLLTKGFAGRVGKGCIINILDTRIVRNDIAYLDYALSKKLLAEFTRVSARILGPRIRVNGIAPGLILPPPGQTISYLEEKARKIPLERPGKIGNITDTVLFLLNNDFITGQIIYVDGGEHLI